MTTSGSSKQRTLFKQLCCFTEQDQTSSNANPSAKQPTNSAAHQPIKSSICKVHRNLRRVKNDAYDPYIVSIGPYHHGNVNFKMMQDQKSRYLAELDQVVTNECRDAIKKLSEQVKKSYDEPLITPGPGSSYDLDEMMLEDGVFIIQLVIKNLLKPNDPIFNSAWIMNSVQRDLLLLENQIPYFILETLFGLIEKPNKTRLIQLLIDFFDGLIPEPSLGGEKLTNHQSASPNHLVDLIHICWCPQVSGSIAIGINTNDRNQEMVEGKRKGRSHNRNQIPTVTELTEAGVKLKNKTKGKNLFDITFQCGTLHIPPFSVDEGTDCFLRNLVAYEQHYFGDNRKTYVTDYVKLLDCLINSPKDVEILRLKGIAENWLGDNGVVASIFNTITDSVVLPSEDKFLYAEVFKKVNGHCESTYHSSMASLKRNYLNGAWGYISVIAATILLVLTALQTWLSYLQVKHG
ncbi:hypothetical protein Leryth_020819 [Lithospermum erythrorhizon]|nr:hypothetical protein Leryth_020819 [Lithospermum erythrorhizon]